MPNVKKEGVLRSDATEQLDSVIINGEEKIVFAYDNNGNLARFTTYVLYFGSTDWSPRYKEEFVFTSDGKLMERVFVDWSQALNDWKPTIRELYTYLPDNRIDTAKFQNWNEGNLTWLPDGQNIYHYDTLDRLEEINHSYYDKLDNIWVLSYRERFLYNPDNLLLELAKTYWNELGGNWLPFNRHIYAYNIANNLILETRYVWNSKWISSKQDTLQYDSYGNMTSITFRDWNSTLNMFVSKYQWEYSYDINTPIEDIIFPKIWFGDYDINNKVLYQKANEYNGSIWEQWAHLDFYYSPVMTSISTEHLLDVRIYPNPATDHLVVQAPPTMIGGEIALLHVSGQPLLRLVVYGEQTILSIQDIPAGMYILQFRSALHGLVSQPLCIQR